VDQGERGEESQQPPESESRTGWTPRRRTRERDPRCHGRGLGPGNRSVHTVHAAFPGRQVLFEWLLEMERRRSASRTKRLVKSQEIRDPITYLP